ncbi:MAG: ABC transporter permease [Gemmataceae bacterium]
MYKALLCWRYLKTRYLAIVCVVSVMLGVATLIVVNSVMAGFSHKLRDRLHGLLSDVSVESVEFDGFADPAEKMRRIAASPAGKYVEAMTPTIETFAMMQFPYRGMTLTKQVQLIGVDLATRVPVGGFAEYLVDQDHKPIAPSFELTDQAAYRLNAFRMPGQPTLPPIDPLVPGEAPPPEAWDHGEKKIEGIIVGQAIACYRDDGAKPTELKEIYTLLPGDMPTIICAGGAKLAPVFDRFAVAGYFKSEMSEYDAHCVFVPLDHLQRLRGMQGRADHILIKLTDYSKARYVVDELKKIFARDSFQVMTWEDKQGPLLAAIDIERGILNVLLFMIVGVAGFGILAIFSMIVVEKTRDIGILKALGASNRGVMGIFLSYGLLLGTVGAILGTVIGLSLTHWINDVEHFISFLTGHEVFNRRVYYFDSIPTFIQAGSVFWVNIGSIAIAVVFSVLPAMRAAMLQPVRALRYE